MKKLLGTVVLGFLCCSAGFTEIYPKAASYLFKNNLYSNCDILTKKDPTSFQRLFFVEEKKILSWDARKQKSSGWYESFFKTFIFKAEFKKSKDVLIRVNSEFKTKEKAEKQALKYGKIVGQLPNFLRTGLKTITIHKGNRTWAAMYDNILIHTGSRGKRKCAEEVMIHEGGHISLDSDSAGALVKSYLWIKAINADHKYISKYAKDFPKREDLAETINWWIAARCKSDRISKLNYKKIIKGIPNRLKYLDELKFDTYPLVCN